MALTMSKQVLHSQSGSVSRNQVSLFEKIAEIVWFLLSFTLFIVLGPFSAPIALIALLQLGCEERDQPFPDSAS